MPRFVSLIAANLEALEQAIKDLEKACPSSSGLNELKRLYDYAVENLDHPAGFAAAESWGYTSDELEVDDDPAISEGEDGAWVSAWVWVSKEDYGSLEIPEV